MTKLNVHEMAQFIELVDKIRHSTPGLKVPASYHIPLVRGRVCVYLNELINAGAITDVLVDRTATVDRYYHN